MWAIKAKFQSGEEKTYTIDKMPFGRIPEIIATAEEEDTELQIFQYNKGRWVKLFDSLHLQLLAEALLC